MYELLIGGIVIVILIMLILIVSLYTPKLPPVPDNVTPANTNDSAQIPPPAYTQPLQTYNALPPPPAYVPPPPPPTYTPPPAYVPPPLYPSIYPGGLIDGTVVRCDTTGAIYKLQGGYKRPYTATSFAYNGKPSWISPSCAILDSIPTGNLM